MKRARNGVARVSAAWRSSWTSVSSASRATSRTSSVLTGWTGSSKWTRLSAPSGSDTSSVPASRSSSPSAGAAVYSGRIPIAIGLPAYPDRPAPRGRRVRQRHALLADLQREPVAVALDHGLEQVHLRAADEAGHEQVRRLVEQQLRIGDLLEPALAQHRDAVAHRHRLDLVVGDVDGRGADLALDARDLRPHLHAQPRVEVRQRLVHQERLRLAHHRPAHRDPLPLAAGELARLAVQQLLEPEHAGDVAHPAVALGARHLAHAQPEADVVAHGHVRVERVVLEDHRDVAVAGVGVD